MTPQPQYQDHITLYCETKWPWVRGWTPPFEVGKISSQYQYDFRNQHPDNALKRIEPLSLEKMKCTDPNPLPRPK